MSLTKDIFDRIDRYLARGEHQPFLIDVQNKADRDALIEHYHVGAAQLIRACDYCHADELPRWEELLADVKARSGVTIVTGLSAFLKLQGERKLRDFIRQMLNMSVSDSVLVVLMQCNRFFDLHDPRLLRRVQIVAGEEQPLPRLVFAASEKYLPQSCASFKGINNLSEALERCVSDTVYVITQKQRDDYPESLLMYSCLQSPYDVIALKDPRTHEIAQEMGSEDQWTHALSLFKREDDTWSSVIARQFGSTASLGYAFSGYDSFGADKRWLYFIALKLFGASGNWCLDTAARQSKTADDFPSNLFRCLLEKNLRDADFWDCYTSRKNVVRVLGNTQELSQYCNAVSIKGKDAICYLTDNTQKEREAIVEYLTRYAAEMDRGLLDDALAKVYPALHDYLRPYPLGNDLLDHYFQEYKFQKVVNTIDQPFLELVEDRPANASTIHYSRPALPSLKRLIKTAPSFTLWTPWA